MSQFNLDSCKIPKDGDTQILHKQGSIFDVYNPGLIKIEMRDCDTPEHVFQDYRAYLAGELSKDFAPDQLDNWIVQLCDTLCKDKSVAYMARFAQLVRKSAHEVGIAKSGSVSYTQRTATKSEQMVMQTLNFMNLEYLREYRVLNLLEARPNYRGS